MLRRAACSLLPLAFAAACGMSPHGERVGEVEQAIKAPLASAYCTVKVIGKGVKATEDDYLPNVITCENGGAGLEALKAQAIAARSVAYYEMASYGDICDSQGCQVYSCGKTPSALAKQAVKETSGIYLSFGGMLTYGFYVNGDSNTAPPACVGSKSSTNEKYVTYNEGKTGTAVKQTPLGFIGPPGFGQNRGCMSQWGARCLEKTGESYVDILRFYYGDDIQLLQAPGSCVTPLDADADDDGVADADDNCPDVVNATQVDTDGDTEGDACDLDDDNDGILDEKDNCPKNANPGQPDADKDGKGDECDGASVSGDQDGDGVADADDTCPEVANPSQADSDQDGVGDFCDPDVDGDGVSNILDDCPLVYDPKQDLPNCQGGFEVTGGGSVQTSSSCAVAPLGHDGARGGLAGLVVATGLALSRRRARRSAA